MPRSRRRDDDDDDDFEDEEDEAPRRSKKGDGLPAGTPRVYVHKKCKGETEMPAKEVRKYLENPFGLGETPKTYCAECEKTVPWKDCSWAETKQSLSEYLDDLRAEQIIAGDAPPPDGISFNWGYPIGAAIAFGLIIGGGGRKALDLGLWAGLVAAVVGGLGGAAFAYHQYKQDLSAGEEWKRKCVSRYYKRHPEAKKANKKRRDDDDEEDDE